MEWKDIIEKRKTNFTWADTPVPRSMIEEIIEEVYNHIPSKQGHMPYSIDVLDWFDEDLRKKIFEYSHRDGNKTIEQDLGNPQVLAPWLFIIHSRNISPNINDSEEILHTIENTDYNREISNIEAGIVATYIMLACESRGLATGLCQCIRDRHLISAEMGRHGDRTILMLGVGYPKDDALYFDPRIGRKKYVPYLKNPYIKPAMDDVWRII